VVVKWRNEPGAISQHENKGEQTVTSKSDRSAISRAVAKAIAYQDCSKPEKAALWAAELARLLGARGILTPTALASRPE
jgi:ubiquitin